MSHARTCKNMSITQIDAEPNFFLKRDMRGTAAGAFPGVAWPRPAGTVRARTLYLLYGADIQRSYGCAKGLLSSVPYEFFTGHTFLLKNRLF